MGGEIGVALLGSRDGELFLYLSGELESVESFLPREAKIFSKFENSGTWNVFNKQLISLASARRTVATEFLRESIDPRHIFRMRIF